MTAVFWGPGVHLDAISAYNVAKKLQLRFVEFTLRQLGIEVMLSQQIKH